MGHRIAVRAIAGLAIVLAGALYAGSAAAQPQLNGCERAFYHSRSCCLGQTTPTCTAVNAATPPAPAACTTEAVASAEQIAATPCEGIRDGSAYGPDPTAADPALCDRASEHFIGCCAGQTVPNCQYANEMAAQGETHLLGPCDNESSRHFAEVLIASPCASVLDGSWGAALEEPEPPPGPRTRCDDAADHMIACCEGFDTPVCQGVHQATTGGDRAGGECNDAALRMAEDMLYATCESIRDGSFMGPPLH